MNFRAPIRRARWRDTVACLGVAGVASLSSLAPAAAQPVCPAGPAVVGFNLTHVRAALARPSELLIVALGSSSTEGIAASDTAHSYPAVLQASLSAALPHAHIAVINRGIGGQDAPEELSRLDHDVIALRPVLVIWQVGANGAMRNSDPAEFQRLVTVGVRRLRTAGIDVILMDNQRAPRVDASPEHAAMQAALAEVARETGAALFSRTMLMDAWAQEGAPEGDFISSDGLHHNDLGYYCVATRLADMIVAGLAPLRPQTVSRQ
jgi:lysophospholipase L1-like esterase